MSQMLNDLDTIVAESTPAGHGALSVIRMSGSQAANVLIDLIQSNPSTSKKLNKRKYLLPNQVIYTSLYQASTKELLDDVVVAFFKSPSSYTGEDIVEISCHGNPIIVKNIINACLELGVRLAEKGEFTKRAFLNGKMDLIQAESVASLISANSEQAVTIAQSNIKKLLTTELKDTADKLEFYLMLITAYVDFPEEELDESLLNQFQIDIKKYADFMQRLLDSYFDNRLFRDGANVVLIGKPNVGKSSLMNVLLNEKRSIISAIPGTTRDFITARFQINGLQINLVDTAGIHETDDMIESQGIDMTIDQANKADLVLYLNDSQQQMQSIEEIYQHLSLTNNIENQEIPVLRVFTKSDLVDSNEVTMSSNDTSAILKISSQKYWGINQLKDHIYKMLIHHEFDPHAVTIVEKRHYEQIKQARVCLQNILDTKNDSTYDVWAFELSSTFKALKEIIGEVTSDSILDKIFSSFCIGK